MEECWLIRIIFHDLTYVYEFSIQLFELFFKFEVGLLLVDPLKQSATFHRTQAKFMFR